MFRDLLERFKRVFTVKEWKREAQDAISKKEFVIASLNELHRVEKAEAEHAQDRVIQRQPNMSNMQATRQPVAMAQKTFVDMEREKDRERRKAQSDLSLADLMNSIRQQQFAD